MTKAEYCCVLDQLNWTPNDLTKRQTELQLCRWAQLREGESKTLILHSCGTQLPAGSCRARKHSGNSLACTVAATAKPGKTTFEIGPPYLTSWQLWKLRAGSAVSRHFSVPLFFRQAHSHTIPKYSSGDSWAQKSSIKNSSFRASWSRWMCCFEVWIP